MNAGNEVFLGSESDLKIDLITAGDGTNRDNVSIKTAAAILNGALDAVGLATNAIEVELEATLSGVVQNDLFIDASIDLTLEGLDSSSGSLSVSAEDDLYLGLLRARQGDVTLTSLGGSIIDTNLSGANVWAQNVSLTSATESIGSAADSIELVDDRAFVVRAAEIEVIDRGGLSDLATVTVDLTDLENRPTGVSDRLISNVPEATASSLVESFQERLVDPETEAGDRLTFTSVSSAFELSSRTDAGLSIGFRSLPIASNWMESDTDLNAILGGTASFSFWINTTQSGSSNLAAAPVIAGLDQFNTTDGDLVWGWILPNGKIRMQVDGNSVQSTTSINDGEDHHVVFSRDSSTGQMQVWVDGVLEASNVSGPTSVSTDFSSIGRIETGGGSANYFQGVLDEFQVFTYGSSSRMGQEDVQALQAGEASIFSRRHIDGNSMSLPGSNSKSATITRCSLPDTRMRGSPFRPTVGSVHVVCWRRHGSFASERQASCLFFNNSAPDTFSPT